MDRDRFSTETITYVVVGLIFLFVFINLYERAFPTASIDLQLTREEAKQNAETFLIDRGYDLTGFENAIVFGVNQSAALFLQKTQGMEKANKMMRSDVPVWRWQGRWFKSAEKEEFQVYVDQNGEITHFSHLIEEAKEGANLDENRAFALAADFLVNTANIDTSQYVMVESSSEKKDNRTDHHLEWKLKGYEIQWQSGDPEAGIGTLRVAVRVQGDEVGRFTNYFKTPEKFNREFENTRSVGTLLGMISLVLMFITAIAALVIFIMKYKRSDIRWKFALTFAILIMALFVLDSLNSLPVAKFGYPTQISYGVFWGILVVVAVFAAILYGVWILFTGASGDSLSREVYPKSIEVLDDIIDGRFISRKFCFASLRGYALAFFFLGYVTIFYTAGRKYLGVFLPAESPYSNQLDTYLPWLSPLAISLLAAVSEEFMSRLFSISFLKKYIKVTFLALLIPAMIWAFGHSTYPVFPVYVRGIELTIAGLIFGYFFIRFNIMTCIIAHYVIDAIFFAGPLLNSSNSYFIVSGYIVIALAAIPLLLGLPGLFRSAEVSPQTP
ncbi:CPBP family intramembrane metalloprotease [candidate division KSB1 bacterium]|nr:CPBP family intramembrane metalloprotease [candidate division KSB1 bacterium]NIR73250.1 CPBP family intramembrane metalloprotease [candidate division KSB1 bacterium]NIS26956.1 CPBP family intramembrane metalloprotease [candidate division KSB1 bacterium]NIT73794.1 CPBP family intramembrane metalloprotease [candidate division KSB1 bacterium]NIU27700.1 CPBP family intramembrane metalloprotease [candidate division KSB1 bacterium]